MGKEIIWSMFQQPLNRSWGCLLPRQTLCAKYSALSRLWEKWNPRLGAVFYSATWHFSLYYWVSFTSLACLMEVQMLAQKCLSSGGFVAPCQVLGSPAKAEQQRGVSPDRKNSVFISCNWPWWEKRSNSLSVLSQPAEINNTIIMVFISRCFPGV